MDCVFSESGGDGVGKEEICGSEGLRRPRTRRSDQLSFTDFEAVSFWPDVVFII